MLVTSVRLADGSKSKYCAKYSSRQLVLVIETVMVSILLQTVIGVIFPMTIPNLNSDYSGLTSLNLSVLMRQERQSLRLETALSEDCQQNVTRWLRNFLTPLTSFLGPDSTYMENAL